MFLVLTFLLCDLSHRYGVSVLVLCGVQELTAVFRLAGHQVPSLSDSLSLFGMEGTAAVSALLTVMVVLVSGLLFWGRSSSTPWGAAFFGVGAMARESDERREIVARCAHVAEAHGLSAREREVLELVALGRTPMPDRAGAGHRQRHAEIPYAAHLPEARHPQQARAARHGGRRGVRASAGRLPIAEVAAPEAAPPSLCNVPFPAPLRRGILYPSGTLQCKVIWL